MNSLEGVYDTKGVRGPFNKIAPNELGNYLLAIHSASGSDDPCFY